VVFDKAWNRVREERGSKDRVTAYVSAVLSEPKRKKKLKKETNAGDEKGKFLTIWYVFFGKFGCTEGGGIAPSPFWEQRAIGFHRKTKTEPPSCRVG